LHEFYGKHDEEVNLLQHTENFLQKIIHKFIRRKNQKENSNEEDHENEEQEIEYYEFTKEATAQLEDLCFVKFD
jgi:hypothetical protein